VADNYACCVCGATDDLWRVRDLSARALVCGWHADMLEDPKVKQLPLRERLEGLGVKFGEQPMDVNYKDKDFLHDCGIENIENWEWYIVQADSRELEEKKKLLK
jgi:hypothetical protein